MQSSPESPGSPRRPRQRGRSRGGAGAGAGAARLLWALAFLLLVVVALRFAIALLYPFQYREVLAAATAEYGVSPHLVAAVIRQESSWRPQSVSRQGARGLMQVMPETGQWAAQQMGWGELPPERLFEPEVNIRIGTWYLAYLIRRFDGNWAAALAAYNGGDHNVKEWMAQGRWTGEEAHLENIPFPETRHFVRRVLRDYRWYQRLYPEPWQ